jgi:hypothetical protein
VPVSPLISARRCALPARHGGDRPAEDRPLLHAEQQEQVMKRDVGARALLLAVSPSACIRRCFG